MSETKWTPGRWSVDSNRPADEGVAVKSDHDFPTISGKSYRIYVAQFCKPEDALLIAAAPDMLEALDDILMALDLPGDHCELEPAKARARAALSKARGTP